MWRSQSSVGEENNIQTDRTINIWPDSFGCKSSKYKIICQSWWVLDKKIKKNFSLEWLIGPYHRMNYICMQAFKFLYTNFVWPVKLLKTQRGKGRQVGWEDCRADLAWRSVRGCKRFSRNPASKTQGLGSAEHKALWTPGEKEIVHINAYFIKKMCHAIRVYLVTRAEIIISEFLIYS